MIISTVVNEVTAEAERQANVVKLAFNEKFRPRVAQILQDMALTKIRRAQGAETSLAEAALDAALANMTEMQRDTIVDAAKTVALTALSVAVKVLAGAAL